MGVRFARAATRTVRVLHACFLALMARRPEEPRKARKKTRDELGAAEKTIGGVTIEKVFLRCLGELTARTPARSERKSQYHPFIVPIHTHQIISLLTLPFTGRPSDKTEPREGYIPHTHTYRPSL